MGISQGCFIKAAPGLDAYNGFEMIDEDTFYEIKKEIKNTWDALNDNNFVKAEDSVADAAVIALDEAMQQVVKCEFEKRELQY